MKRNVLLKHESYNDFLHALNKSGLSRKRFIWERMKANGVTEYSETKFREHCAIVNFITPQED